jgi:hypothetical protein
VAKTKTVRKKTRARKKNPLYVVTNDGKDVESASNFLEAWCKKMGVDFIYQFVKGYIDALVASINSYPMLVALKRKLEEFIAFLEGVMATVPGLGLLAKA